MPDSSLILLLTNTGVAGVFVVLFLTGLIFPRSVVTDLKTENQALKEALEAERNRANAAIDAASSARDVIAAIQTGLQLGRAQKRDET